MKDEMSPFGICSLSYRKRVFVYVDRLTVLCMRCVRLCFDVRFFCTRSLPAGLVFVRNVECVRRKRADALAAPQYCLSPRQGAAEWVRLAQQTPILRGKWSVHNPGQ